MPKEVIKTTDRSVGQVFAEDLSGGKITVVEHINQAELGWSKEAEYVQLGVVTTNPDVPWDERGQFIQMDRDSINRLIVALRRARRQVFGKDA